MSKKWIQIRFLWHKELYDLRTVANEYMIHANETIEKAPLRFLVNDYKNECSMFSAILRNENGYSNHS